MHGNLSIPHRNLIIAFNLTPVPRKRYRVGVLSPGSWQEIFNSDASAVRWQRHYQLRPRHGRKPRMARQSQFGYPGSAANGCGRSQKSGSKQKVSRSEATEDRGMCVYRLLKYRLSCGRGLVPAHILHIFFLPLPIITSESNEKHSINSTFYFFNFSKRFFTKHIAGDIGYRSRTGLSG